MASQVTSVNVGRKNTKRNFTVRGSGAFPDAPKPEIDPERLRAVREARERQELRQSGEGPGAHPGKGQGVAEKITAMDKHKAAMEKMSPGSLDHRAAVKKLARLDGKEQEADPALGKSCKELVILGKQVVKAEVARVLGLEETNVVMQRCGLEKAVKHRSKGHGLRPLGTSSSKCDLCL